MKRKIEWNPDHKDADEQEMEFRMKFLEWPAEKKWAYLMELFKMNNPNKEVKCKKRIEWL